MKKVWALTSTFLLVVFLFGCNANDNNTSDSNHTNNGNDTSNHNVNDNNDKEEPVSQTLRIEDYYPIKENTHYVYEGTGNEYASYEVAIDYISGNKVQQRVDNGGTVMANVVELKDEKLTKLYSRGEAYYRENLLQSKSDAEEILLMEPLEKGNSWTLKDASVRTITDTSAEITTPLGTYSAIEVTTEGEKDQTIDYYAKEIGLVKSVFKSTESGAEEVSSSLSKIEENQPVVQSITFYYPNIDDEKLYYTSKKISFYTNDLTKKVLENEYKESINNNFGNVFSKNTKINSLYLNKDNNVYIDLNQAFLSEMNAGSQYEAMILQSIANTFGQYYNASKVYLTIDNKPYESGHILMEKGEFFKVDTENAIEIQ